MDERSVMERLSEAKTSSDLSHKHTRCDVDYVAALGAAVGRLAGDAELRRRYGAAGRARILAEFSIDAMVDGNLQVYRQVLEARQ